MASNTRYKFVNFFEFSLHNAHKVTQSRARIHTDMPQWSSGEHGLYGRKEAKFGLHFCGFSLLDGPWRRQQPTAAVAAPFTLSLSSPPRCSPQVKWQRQLASVEQNSLHNLNNIRRYSEISVAGFIYKCGMLKISGDIEASDVWVVARVVRATFRHDSFAGHEFGPPFSRRINELVKQVANSNSHRIFIALSGGGDFWTWCAWTSTRVAA